MEYREMDETQRRELHAGRYISLETFRCDGRGVATPVWFAETDGVFHVFTAEDAGKVKRVRGRERSTIARCDLRGTVLGPRIDTRVRIVTDPGEIERGYAALRRRYGWQMRLTDLLSRLSGRIHRRAMIALVPSGSQRFGS